MKTTKRRYLALLLGLVILAALVPLSVLADYYPTGLNLQTYINPFTGSLMVEVSWFPVPLAAGIRIYRNGEQVTTLPGTARSYLDDVVTEGIDYVYRVGAIVDGTEYGSEIRFASESREIGTPAIIRLACDRNSGSPSHFRIIIGSRPADGANYYKLYKQIEGASGFSLVQSRITSAGPTVVDFAPISERIPVGPTTYWFRVRAYDYYNVPATHMYYLYSGPYSVTRAITFYPLDLPDWRSLFDDPERYQRQSWFDALAGLFARLDLMENAELFSSENLAALLGGALGGERDTDAYMKLLGMMHPLGLALLTSGLVSPPDEARKGKLTQLLTQAKERFGNLSQYDLQWEGPEGSRDLLEEICGALGIMMLPDETTQDPALTLYDNRIPVQGPLYTDRAGKDSMLGLLNPNAGNQTDSSDTTIDDDITWSVSGLAQEKGGIIMDVVPAWSAKSVNANKKRAGIDDDITWTIKCTGDTGNISYAFIIFKDGMVVHQSDFSGKNIFTWRVRKPGTYFAVGLVTDSQNGQDMQSGNTIVDIQRATKKPTTKTTPKPTDKPIETEEPMEIPNLVTKPPVVIILTPAPLPPVTILRPVPVKP